MVYEIYEWMILPMPASQWGVPCCWCCIYASWRRRSLGGAWVFLQIRCERTDLSAVAEASTSNVNGLEGSRCFMIGVERDASLRHSNDWFAEGFNLSDPFFSAGLLGVTLRCWSFVWIANKSSQILEYVAVPGLSWEWNNRWQRWLCLGP